MLFRPVELFAEPLQLWSSEGQPQHWWFRNTAWTLSLNLASTVPGGDSGPLLWHTQADVGVLCRRSRASGGRVEVPQEAPAGRT